MPIIAGLLSGVLFGLGLVLGGMTEPAKVIGFLDVAGDWDPSLALVMLGAIAVYAPAYRLITRARTPRYAQAFVLPTSLQLDAPLVAGAGLFGVGWGLAGFCPGPGIVSAGTGQTPGLVFGASLFAGMFLFEAYARIRAAAQAGGTAADVLQPDASHVER